jgi:hypothetical protein
VIELVIERLERLATKYADEYWGASLLPAATERDVAEIESLVFPCTFPMRSCDSGAFERADQLRMCCAASRFKNPQNVLRFT